MVIFSDPYIYVVLAGLWLAGASPDRTAAEIAIQANQALERNPAVLRQHGLALAADDVAVLARRVAASLAAQRADSAVTECDRALRFCIRVEQGGAE